MIFGGVAVWARPSVGRGTCMRGSCLAFKLTRIDGWADQAHHVLVTHVRAAICGILQQSGIVASARLPVRHST